MKLIDVDALIETMRENAEGNEGWYGDTWAFMRDVENAPTIDAIPVVRCKDCEHWDVSKNEYSICCHAYHNMMMVRSDGMGFCSDGERKDNG